MSLASPDMSGRLDASPPSQVPHDAECSWDSKRGQKPAREPETAALCAWAALHPSLMKTLLNIFILNMLKNVLALTGLRVPEIFPLRPRTLSMRLLIHVSVCVKILKVTAQALPTSHETPSSPDLLRLQRRGYKNILPNLSAKMNKNLLFRKKVGEVRKMKANISYKYDNRNEQFLKTDLMFSDVLRYAALLSGVNWCCFFRKLCGFVYD